MPRLIFGIDPGNTIGIAAVDFSGRKVMAASVLNGGIPQAIASIEKIGTPSIIACDVRPIPDSVQKIAASFNSMLWSPAHSIREEEKRQVAQQYSLSSSAHERDALTAAVYAYREHQNRLRQISLLPDFSNDERERLCHMVLNGFTLKSAIISVSQKAGEREEAPLEQKPIQQKHSPLQLESQLQKALAEISRLSHENSNVKKALGYSAGQLSSLRQKIRLLENGVSERLRRDSEVRKLRFENARLRQLLSRILGPKQGKRGKDGQKGGTNPQAGGESQRAGFGSGKKGAQKPGSGSGLNSLGEKGIDLASMVEEYRSNRR